MKRVLVTGANGFVGRELCEVLASAGYRVRAGVRAERALPQVCHERVVVGDITGQTSWRDALRDVDYVVHTAARVHQVRESPANSGLYMETNARGTQQLARMAAEAGVTRFVFLSSIKVNGEQTPERPFTARDTPHPEGPYATSKWLGEKLVLETAARTGMKALVVRPPLVYGPGVQANFLQLIRRVAQGWPLPLGGIQNRRSLVSVWNLCDLIRHALTRPNSPEGIFLVSDGEDLSTPELVERLARALGRSPRLMRFPERGMRLLARLLGREEQLARLVGSLAVDIAETREILGWSPPLSVNEGLARTAGWYLKEGRGRVA